MNSDKDEEQKLPDGWILCNSKSTPGRKYFFNKKTGRSSWTQPQDDEREGKRDHNKQKGKKEKTRIQEKRKEELQKKSLKRKSNSNEISPTKKRKPELSLEKRKPDTSDRPSPVKRKIDSPKTDERVIKNESPIKSTPNKNIANNRLSHLREQLNAEVQTLKQAEAEQSPVKNKHKISPKTPQTDTQNKIQKLDLISPNQNESKCSTTQSPSSDSIQSVPSPSQFFAANKIISAMKAQLPEEYCNKSKPKDTFAAIEEGIYNQTTEFPYMKHPATPPQFSEASKLVSAIKSRLTYKVASKDINLETFSSAKDRLESLRTRLSNEVANEVTDEEFLSRIELPPTEAMDVEDCKEMKQNGPSFHFTKDNIGSKEDIVLVVDTNIFIHELDVIKNVLNSHIKGYSDPPTLLVPWRVINELDRLKDNNNGNGAICKRARSAMDYLYKSLPENNRIKGQSLRDANSHIYPCESPDDEILNCCLQQGEREKSVILLSNDKNLCNKAAINGVKCIGLDELKPLLESKPHETDPDLEAGVKHYENTMYHLLANILENEMRAKYNNLWQHVLFKAPPWSFLDVLQCILKHWIAVFSEVFPRIEHLITDLKNTFTCIQKKDPSSLSQSEVSNFKELCFEIAKKCQIIPEYMELAKVTVERLQRKCASDNEGNDMAVINAFEGLWTVFSSYCSKLASALSIPHSVEDKMPSNDSLPTLTSKWPMFNSQLRELSLAMRGLLSIEATDASMEEQVLQLEIVFKESLTMFNMDGVGITRDNMRLFCTNCRNMLAEASTKFSDLMELLDVCRNKIANQ